LTIKNLNAEKASVRQDNPLRVERASQEPPSVSRHNWLMENVLEKISLNVGPEPGVTFRNMVREKTDGQDRED
jgi:hypothetical protein